MIPLGPTWGVLKIFIRVVESEQVDKLVEVDFLLAGQIPNLLLLTIILKLLGDFGLEFDLATTIKMIGTVLPSRGVHQFPVLKLLSATRSKLLAHFTRNELRDYKDLQWLFVRYSKEIHEFRAELEIVHRQKFIDHCEQQPASSSGGANYVRKMKHILGVP
jgi:hypothetical protein